MQIHILMKSLSKITHQATLALPLAIVSTLILSGCNQKSDSEGQTSVNSVESSESTTSAEHANITPEGTEADDSLPTTTRNQPLTIDWDRIDSGQKAVATKDFVYPFELDSDAVKSQAKFSNISPEQAQHTLTVGMASNEPMEKLLDQLGDSYLSHKFSENDAKLTVYTTPNVKPSQHVYVITHEFARGLTLPIEVVPAPKKEASNSEALSAK